MRYGIDLDGVLADFTERVIGIANSLWPGKMPINYVPNNWDYTGILSKEDWAEVWARIKVTPYFWEDIVPLRGLRELQTSKNANDEIFFITSRATTVGDSPLVQSARWLSTYGMYPRAGYSVVLPVSDPAFKQDLFRGLGLRFMLDDYPPTVEQLNKIEGMHAFLLDAPYNQYAKDLPRVYSVTEYLERIRVQ
jgi:hypothetical protein